MNQSDSSVLLPAPTNKGEIVLYQPDDQISLEVKLEHETVWLTQQQMAILFDVKENNITYHIQSVYKTHELEPESTTQKIRVVRKEGNRQVNRQIDFYNLDMIISVGYRVNSANATQFRRWATSVYCSKNSSKAHNIGLWSLTHTLMPRLSRCSMYATRAFLPTSIQAGICLPSEMHIMTLRKSKR